MAAVESADGVERRQPLRPVVRMPVRIGDVEVGRVSDVLLSRSLGHVLGFVVHGRGARRYFLPWVAARVEEHHVAALSILGLLSTSELAFYLDHGTRLSEALRGLDDVVADRDGDVVGLLGSVAGPS